MSSDMKKNLSFWDVYVIALGQIIGSGIMVLIGIGIDFTAYAIPFAFVLSAVLTIIKSYPIAFLGSAMPATGGLYVYCKRIISPKVGFFYLALVLVTHILISLFALGFAQYAIALIPSLNPTIVAVSVMVFFYLINIIGVKEAAAIQKIMIVLLLLGLSTLIYFGMLEVDYDNFTSQEKLLPNGWYGFGLACAVLSFSTGGAQYVSELGGEMKNPQKDLPKAIIYSTFTAALFFFFVAIVAVGILPIEQTAGKPLAEVAQVILPKPVYVMFIVGAGLFALATSINSTFSWATKSAMIACNDGWLPKGLAKINARFKTPHIMLTILLIIGVIPVITGMEMRYIIMLGGGLVMIYDMIPLIAAFNFPEKLPKEFSQATMKMSSKALKIISIAGLFVLCIQSALSFSDINLTGWIFVISYTVLVILYIGMRSKKIHMIKNGLMTLSKET